MKLSVSIAERDVRFLDSYMAEHQISTRSAALAEAIQSLRSSRLKAEYAAAFDEWEASDNAALWDATVGDGLIDEEGKR